MTGIEVRRLPRLDECGARRYGRPLSTDVDRELIVERAVAGLTAARARERNGGRPFKTTAAKLRLAQAT